MDEKFTTHHNAAAATATPDLENSRLVSREAVIENTRFLDTTSTAVNYYRCKEKPAPYGIRRGSVP